MVVELHDDAGNLGNCAVSLKSSVINHANKHIAVGNGLRLVWGSVNVRAIV
jgi:hypothetical protein